CTRDYSGSHFNQYKRFDVW
nr:immunoglobulin heavy chain junction region [Macaca mulatta]MOV49422.1 immunoglobulin heavy chain junction region [Macaca mulatta]MOV49568.1 immunoglobulin heavy chain junction region [Macaca mulatta]MOV49931.1 immunoglobulin heavy chain junction region [Macaca mulatta]MOV50409.1 immunoglobulin heavy chain junction region [Macaca mulatta]